MSTQVSGTGDFSGPEGDALKAGLDQLALGIGREMAQRRMQADPGPGDDAPTFTREELAGGWGIESAHGDSMSDRLVRFPGTSWDEIDGLTEPPRRTIQHAIFHLLDEPVPPMAAPFPPGAPLPGAYELRVHADGVTIWYTLTEHNGHEVINVLICSGKGLDDSAM